MPDGPGNKELVVNRGEILEIYPFFGTRSLHVDVVRIELNDDGTAGNRAIGAWDIPKQYTLDHFRDFEVEEDGQTLRVEGFDVLPGIHWPEALGHTTGILAAKRYPGAIVRVLPMYRHISGIAFEEPAFAGDRVYLCVELGGVELDKRGNAKMISARGAAVFNERNLTLPMDMTVAIFPLGTGIKVLQRYRDRHLTEPHIVASFANFAKYFRTEQPQS